MKYIYYLSIAALAASSLLSPAAAQLPTGIEPEPEPDVGWTGPSNLIWLGNYLARFVFTLFLILAVIFYLWSAFMYLEARGDEEKIRKAKNALIWGVVSMAVALLAFSIRTVVQVLLQEGIG